MTASREYDLTNGGQGIKDRVLIVVHNGWLSVFGTKRCYLLLEKEYLVFSDSNDNVLFQNISFNYRKFFTHSMKNALYKKNREISEMQITF
jgi:hypothetical protein